jgi:hypothetical protein
MRSAARLMLGLALVAPALLVSEAASAQANMAHTHIGHVADRFNNTPANRGLLATAVAEVEVAVQHAGLTGQQPDNLAYMKQHTGHVLHAIDPSVEAEGPALGYGVKQAALATIQHIEMAAAFDGASVSVGIHAEHIATAARNVVRWSDELIAIAKQIQAAEEASVAAPLVEQMTALANKIAGGHDLDQDGEISWREGEGGLRQAELHTTLLKRAEGIGGDQP